MICKDCKHYISTEFCECRKGFEPTYNEQEECEECEGYKLYDPEEEYWKRYAWSERYEENEACL